MESAPDLGADKDPRTWSIDQVIYELCHNPRPVWSSSTVAQLIPERQSLEDTFRQNHVDGDTLLALDMTTLKEDLGIFSFGQKRAIMRAIEYLRLHSQSYQQMVLQADSIARMQSPAYSTPQIPNSRLSLATHSPALPGLGIIPSLDARLTQSPSFGSGFGLAHFPSLHQQATPKVETPFPKPQSPTHLPALSIHETVANAVPSSGPTNAVLGPLDVIQASVDAELSRDEGKTTDSIASMIAANDDILPSIKPRRKLAPTLISQVKEPTSRNLYLSKESKPLQETFYHCISTDWDTSLYPLPDDDKVNFCLESYNYPSGRRQVIAAQMKHFLQQPVKTLPRDGSLFRMPYGPKRSEKTSQQYFTLFPENGGRPIVRALADFPELKDAFLRRSIHEAPTSRPAPLNLNMGNPSQKATGFEAEEDPSSLGEFAYLLAKYPATEEEVLPLYGDSGDEGELDELTWKEYEEERIDKNNLPSAMTIAEVESTINETLEDYRREWHQTKLPKVQVKAYRTWMRSAKQKSRKAALEHSQFWRDHSIKQLQKLKEAVLKDIWHKPADVKHQCQSMELTTFTIEENTYLVQVLLSDAPPQRPTRAEYQLKPVKRQQPLADGEELIESESDSNDDPNDILDDSSDAGSIHHEPDLDDWNPVIPKKESVSPAAKKKVIHGSIEHVPALKENLPTTPISDLNDHDADVETDSDDSIVTPASRRRTLADKIISPRKLNIKGRTTPQKKFTMPPSPGRTRQLGGSDSDSSHLDRPPRLPMSKYRSDGRSKTSAIDLTMSSPPSAEQNGKGTSSDFNVHTPDLNPDLDDSASRKSSRQSSFTSKASGAYAHIDSSLPPFSDFQGMLNTDWAKIEDISDGRRALAKAVYSLELSTAKALTRLVATVSKDNSNRDGRELLVNGLVILKRDEKSVHGAGTELEQIAPTLALLYMIYCDGQNYLDEVGPSEEHIHNAFEDVDAGCRMFFDLLSQLLQVAIEKIPQQKPTNSNKKRQRDSLSSESLLMDDTDLQISDDFSTDAQGQNPPPSSNKKRKRTVAESQEAKLQQKSDQQRIEDQENRRKVMEQKFAQIEAVNGNVLSPVNFTEPIVYLDPHIASRVKPHQLKGIQFMWREIIEDPRQQGCILAHTMGLGKTMQVISLLVTIAQCNQSKDPRIKEHVPTRSRNGRTLILCPASLLDNWYDELVMWSPNPTVLGTIHKLDSPDEQAVRAWAKNGGILLVSYDRLRRMVNKSVQEKANRQVSSLDLEKLLLEGPSVVVADEAHKMKNPKSGIAQLARRFKTLSRIALTGSPLNNHLEEYHTMIDWIAPGYLGNMVQFKSKYSEPIREGLYSDSTVQERRKALRKLHVLKRDLDPKINRADISAIEQDMPSKTEYFITIPLTDLQKEVYNTYVQYMTQTAIGGRVVQARMWGWLAVLQLLCNHPSCCYDKLKERQRDLLKDQAPAKDQATTENDPQSDSNSPGEGPPTDVTIDTQGSMHEAMEKVLEVFESTTAARELKNTDLSYRTSLVRDILKGAMAVGDKTLIFSHSIPTLTYLERLLRKMKCAYIRLDGKTKMSDRQAMTKSFNKNSTYQVFLISMRAGGLGMNLQGANRVIIFDFHYNPSWEEQAIGRAYRLGQTRPVFVYRFRAGSTFEEVMFEKSVFKQQMFQRVVDHKNPTRHASKDVTEWLFPVKETEQKEFDECIGKDPNVLDEIIKRVDCIRNIELTETFQREDDEKLDDEDVKAAEAEFLDERLQRENPEAWLAKQQEARRIAQTARNQQPTGFPGFPLESPHFRNVHMPPRANGPAAPSPAYGYPSSAFPPFPASRSDVNMSMPPISPQVAQQYGMEALRRTTDDVLEHINRSASQSRTRMAESEHQMS